MFDERIRLSDPEKFSWERTMLPGANDKDINNKRLVEVINAGINKGRIPSSAASLRSINQRLDHFNLRTSEGYLTNAAIFDDRVEFANPGAFPPGTSPESFYKRPQSKPINKLISEIFFKSGLMEAWGRGIPDIFDLCKENGLPKPEFELVNGYVYLTIRFAKPLTPRLSGDKENDKVKLSQLTDRQQKIVSIIKLNDKVTAKEIKSHFKDSLTTINREITTLKEMKVIAREGSDKNGSWVVLI